MRHYLFATLGAFAALGGTASASCIQSSVQALYDRAPAAVIATVVEQREQTVVLDVERTLKGTVVPGRVEVPNPLTSVRLTVPAGRRVGLAVSPDAPAAFGVSDCGVAAPAPFTLAAGPRAGYVVAGGRTLLVLSRAGRELRRITVPRRVRGLARGPLVGVAAVRTAAGVALVDVVSGLEQPGPRGGFRPSRALRLDGHLLRRDGRRVATLPPGRWTSATGVS